MRNFKKIICTALLLVFIILSDPVGSDDGNEDKLRLTVSDVIIRFNKYLKDEQFEHQLGPNVSVTVERQFDKRFNENVVILSDLPDVELKIVERTGQILVFDNRSARRKAYGYDSPLYKGPTLPKFSRDKAISLAKKAVVVISGAFPEDFKLHQAAYNHPFRELGNKCRVGQG